MMQELLIPEGDWRTRLGLKRRTASRVNIRILNAVPILSGGLHRWLHRDDLLAVLYREADRLESNDLRVLADRISEATAKDTP